MSHEAIPFLKLIKKDPRFPIEAYAFVREALGFASDVLEMGTKPAAKPSLELLASKSAGAVERHLTGQQLCEAIRQYALHQFGFMSQVVLNDWGIYTTSDFGDIVYNMIDAGLMKKSDDDRRSDFDEVYDFDDVFQANFQICKTATNR